MIKNPMTKLSNQLEKIFQKSFRICASILFADALLLMPRFAPTIKSLLMNKEKLLELAKIPLNENCSAMLLKKLPEKLGVPGEFLIPIDNLLNENPLMNFILLIEPDAPVINNVDELNEDECFDPGGGKNNVEVNDSFTIILLDFSPVSHLP
ncbi:hypothetical protein Tco_1212199 [Tanacetum coccineum]